jgi:hypothetical protein
MSIKTISITFWLLITFLQCSNRPTQIAPAANSNTEAPTSTATHATAIERQHVEPISLNHLPKPSASKSAFLSTGRWHCFAAMRPNDAQFQNSFPVTDLKFSQDGSVVIYADSTVLANGQWAVDEAKNQIFISSTIEGLNTSWKVLEKGFRMVWIGNTELNIHGDQIRWDCHK